MTDLEAKAREIVRDWFGFDLDDDLPADHDLAKIILTALRSVRKEALEEAAKVAQIVANEEGENPAVVRNRRS